MAGMKKAEALAALEGGHDLVETWNSRDYTNRHGSFSIDHAKVNTNTALALIDSGLVRKAEHHCRPNQYVPECPWLTDYHWQAA